MADDEEDTQTEEKDEEAHGYISTIEDRVFKMMHDIPESVHEAFRRHRRTAFERHPFVFSTLGLFGLVATWQGFDDVVERVELFDKYPSLLLGLGLLVLLFTGRLYRQLDR